MDTHSLSVIFKNQPPELRLWTKIQEQSNLKLSCAQVIQGLRFMAGIYSPRCLQFDQYCTVHNQVGFVVTYLSAAKPNRSCHLVGDLETRVCKSNIQSLFVNCLQESEAEFVVHSIEDLDDVMTEVPMFSASFLRLLF